MQEQSTLVYSLSKFSVLRFCEGNGLQLDRNVQCLLLCNMKQHSSDNLREPHSAWCVESLVDAYTKLRTDPDSPLPTCQPLNTLILLSKLSFEEDYRTVMNDVGVSLTEAVKYGCTALTNLTCGDQHVKTALSHLTPFLEVLLGLLHGNETQEVVKVVISLFRNLSWRASSQTKQNLARCQVCSVLVDVGRRCSDAGTMKVLTSCLWNLSAHNSANKEISKSANGALRNIMTGSAGSRSVSPCSHDDQFVDHVPDHVVPPSQFWFDDYSLISSGDSRSRTSTSPKQERRKIVGRQQHQLRFSSTVDKFSC
ncbi:hypothetical protein ACHWQZ_G010889 [Mnemiopsis leidyi]